MFPINLRALSGKFTHWLYSVLVGYSVYAAVFQRKQHSNLSYTITLSPTGTTYYGVRTPTDMTYIAALTPKHTQKQMRLYAKNM